MRDYYSEEWYGTDCFSENDIVFFLNLIEILLLRMMNYKYSCFMDLSFLYEYRISFFLILLALLSIWNLFGAKTLMAKVIYAVTTITLFLIAFGYMYIHSSLVNH